MMQHSNASLQPFADSTFVLEVVHNFIRHTARASTEQDIFWAITKNFMQTLQIEDCVVYEARPQDQKIVQRAAHGVKNPNGEIITNLMTLNYGEGIAGWVAKHQQIVRVADTRKDKRHIIDVESRLSELCVPIQLNGILYGIISSENSALGYYTEQHEKVFELIADIAANLIVRIRQQNELKTLKEEIESLLEEKKNALYEAIETVSDQVTELKHQKEKREILLREVHHRVNNNLQILSSIVNLYLLESKNVSEKTLHDIKNRVQILSSIHLILLKSVETGKHSTKDFLLDLVAAIRYMNHNNYLVIHVNTNIAGLNLNTLVPLGLLVYSLIDYASTTYWKKGKSVELNLTAVIGQKSGFYVNLDALHEVSGVKDPESVNETLIEALVEQLDGRILPIQNLFGLWNIHLNEIE
ncbi:MAG: GAF domain-containing protein [Bacteroidetes bacterium]|nr:MAG: GAF domain-containing protein [Bacteroidota bacterium]